MPVPKVCSALRSIGNPAAYPLMCCATRPSRRRSGAREGCEGRGAFRGRTRHLQHTPTEGEATGKVARRQGLQVGRARQLWVDRLEPAGGLQQHGRGLTAPIREERELSPHQLDASLLKVAQRPSLSDREQVPRRVERAGLDFGRRCCQRPLGAAGGVERQHRGALEECRRRSNTAARLRPVRRALQLRGDVLIRPSCGLCPMPGVSIGVLVCIGDSSQRSVHFLSFLRGRRPVDRRAHEGMPKPHSRAELD